jgi:hypothetical protein
VSVARTTPAGSAGESPVALTADAHAVMVGTSGGGFGLSDLSMDVLAPPAA